MATILIVEDDRELRELYALVLEDADHNVLAASCADEALNLLEAKKPDLAICDVMLPGVDGFELVRTIRRRGHDMPVLFITAKGTLSDKREGFSAGADDYVVKPVDVREMLWRVEALLRRANIVSTRTLHIAGSTLDADKLCVETDGTSVDVPQKEFWLLFKLLSNPGRIFTRRQLLEDVWGPETQASDHTLDVHISRLRERFRENGDFSIVTVRGLGYKGVLHDENA